MGLAEASVCVGCYGHQNELVYPYQWLYAKSRQCHHRKKSYKGIDLRVLGGFFSKGVPRVEGVVRFNETVFLVSHPRNFSCEGFGVLLRDFFE